MDVPEYDAPNRDICLTCPLPKCIHHDDFIQAYAIYSYDGIRLSKPFITERRALAYAQDHNLPDIEVKPMLCLIDGSGPPSPRFVWEVEGDNISAPQLARELGVAKTTIIGWIKNGTLPAERVGHVQKAAYAIPRQYANALMERRNGNSQARHSI